MSERSRFFTKDHFESYKGLAPAYLAELVAYCLDLVSDLSASGLSYRFKGGNSLLILLEDPQRFSIDVDIVTSESKENLIALVEKIAQNSPRFTSVEIRAPKTKPWLPMISFKLFFHSFYQKPEDSFVMLDAVLEPSPYEGVLKKVKCLDIYQSEQMVEVPSVSGLMGDKLLTIGPATLGIPLGKNKEAQRLKHIFDVSLLAKQEHDIQKVKKSLDACMVQENKIQNSQFSFDEVFDDTLLFCSQALEYKTPPQLSEVEPNTYLYEIIKGFSQFKSFLFRIEYTWEMFQDNCSTIIAILKKIKAL